MEIQLAFGVWDSLSELNGRCLKWNGAKRTSQMSWRTQVTTPALFCQRSVISGYGVFWGSSTRVSCLKGCVKDVWNVCVSSQWLVSKFSSVWQVFLFLKQELEVVITGLYRLSYHIAYFSLGPSDLWIWFTLWDMDQCSRDSGLT